MSNLEVWIEALESGRFEQARFVLCRVDEGKRSFCCLGVACELALESGVSVHEATGSTDITTHGVEERSVQIVTYDDEKANLPRSVREWLGVDVDEAELIEMNDDGVPFVQIAADLRRRYLG